MSKVCEETRGELKELCLKIYLKNTVFAQADKPDETIWLRRLINGELVETVIDHLKPKKLEND